MSSGEISKSTILEQAVSCIIKDDDNFSCSQNKSNNKDQLNLIIE